MVATTSIRRFDLGLGSQPIFQFIVATLPLFLLLVWFIFNSQKQLQRTSCYDEGAQEGYNYNIECSEYIPIEQFVYVSLVLCFCFELLTMYLQFFVKQRHALIHKYLSEGETVIGTVYNIPNKSNLVLTSHGYVVYEQESKKIRRKVPIFERYTRERAAILCLPGLPLSGQPKVDLEIDRDTFELNKSRLAMLERYVWAWTVFCTIAPIFMIINFSSGTISDSHLFTLYAVLTFIVIPTVTVLWMYVAWRMYQRWMTVEHTILKDDQPENVPARKGVICCFDDQDCESIQMTDYVQMPASEQTKEKKAKIGFT